MKTSLIVLIACFPLLSCTGMSQKSDAPPAAPIVNYFENMDGCFLLYNMNTRTFDAVIGEQRCRNQYPPASTFKVPLAVMAFDAKILKDENQILKWDGKKSERVENNMDHNAQTWMRDSVVWFSQRLTPQIGKKKFQKYLKRFDYGNQDLSAGITEAWLVSPASTGPALKISAYEQVVFMKKLWLNQLPATERAMQLTRDITYLEISPNGYHLNGKTGSNFYDSEHKVHFGWFVGHIVKDGQAYIAVTNFSDLAPVESGYGGLRAKEITKRILTDKGLW